MKIFKQLLVLLVIVTVPVWLWIKYDDRNFLRYGALHIAKTPKSLNLLDYDSYGASDFRAEYYFSINPIDFNKLLSGRRYDLKASNYDEFRSDAVNKHNDLFQITNCYSSNIIDGGLVNIYTNQGKNLVYVVYTVR